MRLRAVNNYQIWRQWRFGEVTKHALPFYPDVCRFIQTYQMPLQGTRKDRRWGKVDLVGATPDALPVVIELKQEQATDTPLRMLVEGLAYACAVRKAWNESGLRAEWTDAMRENGFTQELPKTLVTVPLFRELVLKCNDHGFPIHFVQFDIVMAGELNAPTVSNVSIVHLPIG
jgi:hypothetical protein